MLNRRLRSVSLALCTLLITLAPVAIRADAPLEAKTAIQAVYNRESAAINKKDVEGVLAIYTADYVEIGQGGKKRSLAETKQEMQGIFATLQAMKMTQTISKVMLKGEQATVQVKQHMDAALTEPQTHKKHSITMSSSVEDIWVKSGKSGWLKKHSKTLSEQGTMDGKPMKG